MTKEEFQEELASLRPQLTSIASRFLSDDDEAEDIVQDVLMKLWLMCEDLRKPMDGLAKVLTRNYSIDYLRRKHPREDIENLQLKTETNEKSESIDQMMKVIEQLPSKQQTILRLRHMEGMEMKDIAELIGTNEVAIRKSLSRARMAVRDEYIKRYQNEK